MIERIVVIEDGVICCLCRRTPSGIYIILQIIRKLYPIPVRNIITFIQNNSYLKHSYLGWCSCLHFVFLNKFRLLFSLCLVELFLLHKTYEIFCHFLPTLPKQRSICNLVPGAFSLPSHFIIDAFYQLSQSSFTFGQNWLVMKNNKPRGFDPVRYRKNDICKKLGSICQIVIRKSLWISIDITCQELKIRLTALVR